MSKGYDEMKEGNNPNKSLDSNIVIIIVIIVIIHNPRHSNNPNGLQ